MTQTRPLLTLDPELGQLLEGERLTAAQAELTVRVTQFGIGEWPGSRLADTDPAHVGLLIVHGVLARELVLEDTVSTELLGPGDVVRPWSVVDSPRLLAIDVRWNVLSAVELGLIDRRAAAQLGRYPEIGAVIANRVAGRAHRLAIMQAISQLTRVDRRLLALFWHLAERWGRTGPGGILVPLALSHRLLGQLVGARRPTVSSALAELARAGDVTRQDDGSWLLRGEPVAVEVVADLPPEPVTRAEQLAALRATLATRRATMAEHGRRLELLRAQTRVLRARADELCAQRRRLAAAASSAS